MSTGGTIAWVVLLALGFVLVYDCITGVVAAKKNSEEHWLKEAKANVAVAFVAVAFLPLHIIAYRSLLISVDDWSGK